MGELAEYLCPGGIEVRDKGKLEALAATAELLKRDSVALFEPAIAFGECLSGSMS